MPGTLQAWVAVAAATWFSAGRRNDLESRCHVGRILDKEKLAMTRTPSPTRETRVLPRRSKRHLPQFAYPCCCNPLMMLMSGMKSAMTIVPTINARKTIMIGSSNDVRAATELSTSSS
jgi:hypothetical protein